MTLIKTVSEDSPLLLSPNSTYFNSINAKNIGRSAVYTLTAPLAAIGSVTCCFLGVICTTCLRPFAGSKVSDGLNGVKAGDIEYDYDRRIIDEREMNQTIKDSYECLNYSKLYFKYMNPFEPLEKTIRDDSGELVTVDSYHCCLTINCLQPHLFCGNFCKDDSDNDNRGDIRF